jgi:rhodanese-related sulfurtransferase
MNAKRFFLEAAALIAAAVVCALVSNALAARERKLALVSFYPNAQKVPAQTVTAQPVAAAVPAAGTAPSPPPPAPATETVAVRPAKTPAATAPVPAPAPPKKPDLARFAVHADKPYVEIAYNDVKALHDAGVLFLDARRTSIYEQGHIAGARPFSVWESDVDDKVRKFYDERSEPAQQALPIVVYCSGGDCEDSHMLAQKLWGIQFNNVYVYKDGYPDWVAHKGDTHAGSNP